MRAVLAVLVLSLTALAGCSSPSSPSTCSRVGAVEIEFDLSGTWQPGGISTGQATNGAYLWKPMPLSLETPEGLALIFLDIKLAWTNEPASFGDLGIGVGVGTSLQVFRDSWQNAGFGSQSEWEQVDRQTISEEALDDPGLAVGPASDLGYFAPGGLAYVMQVTATFAEPLPLSCGFSVGGGGGAGGGGGGGAGGGGGVSIPGMTPGILVLGLACLAVGARRR